MVQSGAIKDDAAQREAVVTLQHLMSQLQELPSSSARSVRGSIANLAWVAKWIPGFRCARPRMTKGLYIWGNVGRGKSMLMDLFFEAAPITQKRRVHFHAFMQEVHGSMHQFRQNHKDPVLELVHQLADKTRLLCFDELQATDVADATLLYRLFSGLFNAGVTIVSTSNHPPASLYTGGVQKERFAKFIKLIESHMQVMGLSSNEDYRQNQIKSLQRTYFSPLGKDADAFIADTLEHLCDHPKPVHDVFSVHGRKITFRRYGHAIGYFTFQELCAQPLGAADYLAIAKRLKTVILVDIPHLTPENRNEAKRFVTLVDILYEQHTKLICTAATAPQQLYTDGDGAFEFQRTVSRLMEMQSQKYLAE